MKELIKFPDREVYHHFRYPRTRKAGLSIAPYFDNLIHRFERLFGARNLIIYSLLKLRIKFE
jgi:hypothetical protein